MTNGKEPIYSELEATLSGVIEAYGKELSPTEIVGCIELVKSTYLEIMFGKVMEGNRAERGKS